MADTPDLGRRRREEEEPRLIDESLAEELIARARAEGVQLLGDNGLLQQMTKVVLERELQTELTEHLGYEAHDPAGRHSGNSRNGSTGSGC